MSSSTSAGVFGLFLASAVQAPAHARDEEHHLLASVDGIRIEAREVFGHVHAGAVAANTSLSDDHTRFDEFVASRPTPKSFRGRYPAIELVMPEDLTTAEFRMDDSRYFANLDSSGRIVGGRFG